MKNIHVLPTDKPSRLVIDTIENKLYYQPILHNKTVNVLTQHIYITSDDKFVKDEYITDGIEVIQASSKLVNAQGLVNRRNWRKIILTTDQDLIKDSVQAIDDEFLEWFVKNLSCEFVKVDQEKVLWKTGEVTHYKYKIIIPKEEQKKILIDMMKSDEELGLYDDIEINRIEVVCKDCSDSLEDCTCIKSTVDFPRQEIKLEEVFNDDKKENIKKFIDEIQNPSEPNQALKDAFEKYSEYLEDFENKNTYEHGFKDGAKCQQQISYSEEEVIAFGEFIFKHSLLTHTRGVKSLFEQFKKK